MRESIYYKRTRDSSGDKIYQGEDKIDLIVTDMQYPLEVGEAVDEEAGIKLVERMEQRIF